MKTNLLQTKYYRSDTYRRLNIIESLKKYCDFNNYSISDVFTIFLAYLLLIILFISCLIFFAIFHNFFRKVKVNQLKVK